MRKFLILVLIATMAISSACTESIDLDSLTFDELKVLKQSVDLEFHNRHEADPFSLAPGVYIAGEDIPTGNLFAAMVFPDTTVSESGYYVYDSMDAYVSDDHPFRWNASIRGSLSLGDNPVTISLAPGNALYLSGAAIMMSVSIFQPSDFYQFQPADGTFVAPGLYFAGADIPVGEYSVRPGSLQDGRYILLIAGTNSRGEDDYIIKPGNHQVEVKYLSNLSEGYLSLQDGDILEVRSPLIMKKKQPLSFD